MTTGRINQVATLTPALAIDQRSNEATQSQARGEFHAFACGVVWVCLLFIGVEPSLAPNEATFRDSLRTISHT